MKRDELTVKTPRGCIIRTKAENGEMTAKLEWNPGFGPGMTTSLNAAQNFIDSEVLRLSSPYVPFQTGMLHDSGILGTVIGSGWVIWSAPYAAAQYYNTADSRSYDARRGARWFERMKADHGSRIIAGAKKIGGSR